VEEALVDLRFGTFRFATFLHPWHACGMSKASIAESASCMRLITICDQLTRSRHAKSPFDGRGVTLIVLSKGPEADI
jgi:hypothetical protein